MIKIFEIFCTLFFAVSQIIAWHFMSKRKINLKNKFLYIALVFLVTFTLFNYYFILNYFKGVLALLMLIISSKIILNCSVKESIILCFITEFTTIISEAVLIIVIHGIFKIDMNIISNEKEIACLLDIIIAIIIILCSRLKIINRFYLFVLKITNKINITKMLFFIGFVMFGCSVVFTSTYFKNNIIFLISINIIVSLIYAIIVILVFNYQNRYYKINYKYNISLENLQAQELVINEYRMINHENKNQLLTIKSMTRNKQVIRYIDSLISQKQAFKNEIINTTLKLPEGGIRGLIYSKMLYMKDKNIDCYLNVDKKITSKILANINDNDIVDICHILGVFIDNAIQETLNLDDKKINIYLHLSTETLSINISNNHHQKFGPNKNNETLKTTKGKGHGYGLSLVKRIVDRNERLINNRKITRDTFTQELIIKLK